MIDFVFLQQSVQKSALEAKELQFPSIRQVATITQVFRHLACVAGHVIFMVHILILPLTIVLEQ